MTPAFRDPTAECERLLRLLEDALWDEDTQIACYCADELMKMIREHGAANPAGMRATLTDMLPLSDYDVCRERVRAVIEAVEG
jgi:hypothetical protein